jgi:putative FmdB family regulatory protein
MPVYDYKCQKCGKVTEMFQRKAGVKKISCPDCGSLDMDKMLSAPGLVKVEEASSSGATCCGREERCDAPPCSSGENCQRDQ